MISTLQGTEAEPRTIIITMISSKYKLTHAWKYFITWFAGKAFGMALVVIVRASVATAFVSRASVTRGLTRQT